MKKHIADAWVAALRSGTYKQTNGALQSYEVGFCCLGVLCDLASKQGVGKWDVPEVAETGWNIAYSDDWGSAASYPPTTVAAWADMKSSNPIVHIRGAAQTLAGMNDTGSTFAEIADIIEANWEKL